MPTAGPAHPTPSPPAETYPTAPPRIWANKAKGIDSSSYRDSLGCLCRDTRGYLPTGDTCSYLQVEQ